MNTLKIILLTFTLYSIPTVALFSEWTEFNKRMRKEFVNGLNNDIDSTIGHTSDNTTTPSAPDAAEPSKAITLQSIKGSVPQEIYDLRDYLKNPQQFEQLGMKLPSGILLVGKPGTGKTTIARALAAEVDIPFIYVSASEFIEMYVGVGAARIRELFKKAHDELAKTKKSHAIIFIDEIDALGTRNNRGGGSTEENRTIDELLTQMDGFNKKGNIIIIAATNKVDLVDPALRRPGRFEEIIEIPLPNNSIRLEILKYYLYDPSFKRKIQEPVSLDSIALQTEGWSGAELEGLIKKATIFAVRARRSIITQADLNAAHQHMKKNHELAQEVSYY